MGGVKSQASEPAGLPAPPLLNSMTTLLHFSVTRFPHLQNGSNISPGELW